MMSFNTYQVIHKSGRSTPYVEACWKADGAQKHVAYSANKHGWHGATVKAITARETSQGISLGINAAELADALRAKAAGETQEGSAA